MLRRRLIWQLYPSFLGITLAALVAVTAYYSYTLRQLHLSQIEEELRLAADVAAVALAEVLAAPTPDAVDSLCKKLGEAGAGQMRLTVVTPSGKVLGDSDENPAIMDDHSHRAEIIDALREGYGCSLRVSPTLGMSMMYVAVAILDDGLPVAVVRAAVPITAIDRALRSIYISIVWAGLTVALCAALLSLLISRRISQPIGRMTQIAQLFAQGNLNLRVPTAASAELTDLAKSLNEMAGQLQDRILTITNQRNELEAVLSSMVEGVFAVDSHGRIVSLNKAAAHLLSIDPAHAQGRSVEEVVRNVELQQFVRSTLSSDQPTESEVSFPQEGGRFFQGHGVSLAHSQGERGGAVIVLSDTTRIHRLENLRRDFVANVSHELKTPVTSIQGFVEALQEGDLAQPEQARYLGIIARHSLRLNAIIDDLLSLSRFDEVGERRGIAFEKTPLRPVLEAAVETAGLKAGEKGIQIRIACDDAVEARLNAPLFEQAVVNLVDNAVKYSHPGGVVEIAVRRADQEVAVVVKDDGCGIAAEHLSRLFERFYVVDKSRSRKLGGTGLGLAIVKHIAQVHGGRVTVESALGKGSTFTIHLPRA